MSISGSQDESEGEHCRIPLPPIIKNPKLGSTRKPNYLDKQVILKNEYSYKSLRGKLPKAKRFNEDLIKVDKAKMFKKTFVESNRRKGKKLQ